MMNRGFGDPFRLAGRSPGGWSRRRWRIAGAFAVLWFVLMVLTRSIFAGTLLAVALVAIVAVAVAGLHSLGIDKDSPMIQSLGSRPWRSGPDVFRRATGRMPDVFIITPKGALIAPSAIEVRMSPADVDSLADAFDAELMNVLAKEAYEAAVSVHDARVLRGKAVDARVVADPRILPGRYQLRQRRTDDPRLPAGDCDPNPLLVLVTGNSRAQTRTSGACAGRSRSAELLLPEDPAVSRVHAKFTCRDGQWEIAGMGRNGVLINGAEIARIRSIYDGDLIRWGRQEQAPTSIVQIVGDSWPGQSSPKQYNETNVKDRDLVGRTWRMGELSG
jgi:FHA domain